MGRYVRAVWWHLTDRLCWRVAWWLPRQVALYAFVRVSAVIGECGPEYDQVYRAWTQRD